MLSKLAGKHQSYCSLDLLRSDHRLLVVASQPRCLLGQLLEAVIDEAVHYPHGLAGDPDVRVNLLQHLEDVDLVGLNALLRALLLLVTDGNSGLLR